MNSSRRSRPDDFIQTVRRLSGLNSKISSEISSEIQRHRLELPFIAIHPKSIIDQEAVVLIVHSFSIHLKLSEQSERFPKDAISRFESIQRASKYADHKYRNLTVTRLFDRNCNCRQVASHRRNFKRSRHNLKVELYLKLNFKGELEAELHCHKLNDNDHSA